MRRALVAATVAALLSTSLTVEAKESKATDTVLTELSAKRHHYRTGLRRYGACDGFQRCRCGVTAANYAGISYNFNGWNLKRAREWLNFPRTSPHSGAVGYVRKGGPSGHVFTIVSYSGGSTATVYDDRGTYERNISNAIFVSPSGGSFASNDTGRRGSKRHRRNNDASYAGYTYANAY